MVIGNEIYDKKVITAKWLILEKKLQWFRENYVGTSSWAAGTTIMTTIYPNLLIKIMITIIKIMITHVLSFVYMSFLLSHTPILTCLHSLNQHNSKR